MSTANARPLVGIVMGSKSDWETMKACRDTLREFGVESAPGEDLVVIR